MSSCIFYQSANAGIQPLTSIGICLKKASWCYLKSPSNLCFSKSD